MQCIGQAVGAVHLQCVLQLTAPRPPDLDLRLSCPPRGCPVWFVGNALHVACFYLFSECVYPLLLSSECGPKEYQSVGWSVESGRSRFVDFPFNFVGLVWHESLVCSAILPCLGRRMLRPRCLGCVEVFVGSKFGVGRTLARCQQKCRPAVWCRIGMPLCGRPTEPSFDLVWF